MQELLKNAWQGWLYYTECGKYAALLLAVLLYLWFCRERCKEQLLLVYTTIVTGCCIFPITAAILMKYQTLFYDYQWIWGCVPVTLMIAYGAVVFLEEQKERRKKEKDGGKHNGAYIAALTVAMVAVVVLCGRPGKAVEGMVGDSIGRENIKEILVGLEQQAGEREILLWAPAEVMELARGLQPDIRLVYGRDMWEAALGAYSYDVYSETEQQLYLWMCNVEETGGLNFTTESGVVLDGMWGIQTAEALGVNGILLPDTVSTEELQQLLNKSGQAVKQIAGYYLLWL